MCKVRHIVCGLKAILGVFVSFYLIALIWIGISWIIYEPKEIRKFESVAKKVCHYDEKEFKHIVKNQIVDDYFARIEFVQIHRDVCRLPGFCQAWILDKKFTPEEFNRLFLAYEHEHFISGEDYRHSSLSDLYISFVRDKLNGRVYNGGPINFDLEAVLFDVFGSIYYLNDSSFLFNGQNRVSIVDFVVDDDIYTTGIGERPYSTLFKPYSIVFDYKLNSCGILKPIWRKLNE
ncbi:hypothetical protein [Avibacterium paragallinarum]|uniref:hypothetical protein n=1 Tax=Avibacterium paragallinarum TaxID=728 RepID=UPI000614B81E|nr:hypothetical protein [Avibacterium paragallinarum]QLD64221.1 hypothetical protein VY92_002015 [Avibacterium paragallinarum]TID29049.1 hypothetical protein JO83_01355 [Avibacterium paragallinarum]